jgi:hypothetical protein
LSVTLRVTRLWYLKTKSPLFGVIERYSEYFNLFVDFKGFIDFFLLNDLVSEQYKNIKFWLPFESFGNRSPIPVSTNEYNKYMINVMNFVKLRNNRILEWVNNK